MARRSKTVEPDEDDLARARCAFVGGLKDESRMYNVSFRV
jgi:hypothetical protein